MRLLTSAHPAVLIMRRVKILVEAVELPGIAGVSVVKRHVLRRFLYNIVVQESSDEIIVIAIAHHSRRPG